MKENKDIRIVTYRKYKSNFDSFLWWVGLEKEKNILSHATDIV